MSTVAASDAWICEEHPDQPWALVVGTSSGWTVKTYESATFERIACSGVTIVMKVE